MNELLRTILFLPEQRSTVAREIDGLHYFVILVTMAGAVLVTLFALYYVLRYRASAQPRGGFRQPDTSPHHSAGGIPLWLEIAVIGGLLSLFLVWWVIGFRQFVRLQTPPEDSIDVYVTGKKWMWKFAYPQGGRSNTVLYVPVGRPVRLVMTSRDVIHSFYVPEFRIKQDVIPGRITTVWFEVTEPGTYPILCAEYCGTGHSTMRGQVVALADVDYEDRLRLPEGPEIAGPAYTEPAMVRPPPGTALTLAQMGERVAAEKGCLRCHTVDGTPHIGPTWARLYGSRIQMTTGELLVADEAYLTESMMDPMTRIRSGYPPVMPSYQGLLTAGETGALVEYIRSLRFVPIGAEQSPLSWDETGRAVIELPATVPGREPVREQERLEPTIPVPPLEEMPPPRPDQPPYPPPGIQEQEEIE